MAIDRLIAQREVHLREKSLWRMLYGTSGRAEEILDVNIEDLDWTSTPRCAGRGPAGTCTSTAVPHRPTSERRIG